MANRKEYTSHITELMAKKTAALSRAEWMSNMGLRETVHGAWSAAAMLEEQIAPLMETLGRDDEAALHRVSAASCFDEAGEIARAVNLYRAALSGPLSQKATRDVRKKLAACLAKLSQPM